MDKAAKLISDDLVIVVSISNPITAYFSKKPKSILTVKEWIRNKRARDRRANYDVSIRSGNENGPVVDPRTGQQVRLI